MLHFYKGCALCLQSAKIVRFISFREKKSYLEQEGSYQILVKWKLTHSLLVQAGLYK